MRDASFTLKALRKACQQLQVMARSKPVDASGETPAEFQELVKRYEDMAVNLETKLVHVLLH